MHQSGTPLTTWIALIVAEPASWRRSWARSMSGSPRPTSGSEPNPSSSPTRTWPQVRRQAWTTSPWAVDITNESRARIQRLLRRRARSVCAIRRSFKLEDPDAGTSSANPADERLADGGSWPISSATVTVRSGMESDPDPGRVSSGAPRDARKQTWETRNPWIARPLDIRRVRFLVFTSGEMATASRLAHVAIAWSGCACRMAGWDDGHRARGGSRRRAERR